MTVNFIDSRAKWKRRINLIEELSPLVWYDASDISTITSSGGAVSQWNDKSGNGKHLTQATGSAKPITGFSQNGLNTIQFASTITDTPRYLQASTPADWSFLDNGNTNVVIGIVQKGYVASTTRYLMSTSTSSTSQGASIQIVPTSVRSVRVANPVRNSTGSTIIETGSVLIGVSANPSAITTTVNQWVSGTFFIDYSNRRSYRLVTSAQNNVNWVRPFLSASFATTPPPTALRLGVGPTVDTTTMHVGEIGEVVMVTGSNATFENALALRQLLIQKWGTIL